MKTTGLKKLTTSKNSQHPDARFIRLASQGVFIFIYLASHWKWERVSAATLILFPPKKIYGGQPPKLPARIKNLAQGWLTRLKYFAENQKWTPERVLFNGTNERFQLGRTAEKIDFGDNRCWIW